MEPVLSVREITTGDVPFIVAYWAGSTPAFLKGMGADPGKLPPGSVFTERLHEQIRHDYPQKQSYCIIWEAGGQPVGHCNVSNIIFGEEAYMHLHMWQPEGRQKGWGSRLVKYSLPYFFNNLQLKKLFSEPYALNPAPHKTLQKVGFQFEKEYITIPGSINFEQPVKRWSLSLEDFRLLPV